MFSRAFIFPAMLFIACSPARGQTTGMFATTASQVLRLVDVNGDGDFLDFSEVRTYASSFPNTLGAVCATPTAMFVAIPGAATVYLLRDLNHDGDALDFAEAIPYAQLPAGTLTPVGAGLAQSPDGGLYAIDSANNMLFRINDDNADGDAFDFGEVLPVASGLASPVEVTTRPDGCVLVSQNNATIPVRILRDRNADGDFFDFAENISYAESFTPGAGLANASQSLAYLARSADATILKLSDMTGDNDVLDFGEVLSYATSLTGVARLAVNGNAGLLAGANDAPGSIYRVQDLNADGDAIDFNEALIVAQAGAPVLGLTTISLSTPVCSKGDVNFDTFVNTADIPLFASIVIGATTPADPCPADVNDDGLIDGRDIREFIVEILP
jgi:hypothetical protein